MAWAIGSVRRAGNRLAVPRKTLTCRPMNSAKSGVMQMAFIFCGTSNPTKRVIDANRDYRMST
jgi:hypothetical protein